MGTNTITNSLVSPNKVVRATHVSQYFTALNEDFVPRNSSGVATGSGGSLGTNSLRWAKGIYATGVGVGVDPDYAAHINGQIVTGTNSIMQGTRSSIIGGNGHVITSVSGSVKNDSFIGGGVNHFLNGDTACSVGGSSNTVTAQRAAAIGGTSNVASGDYSLVAGFANSVDGGDSVCIGGFLNSVSGDESFILAGGNNIVSGFESFILSGDENLVSGHYSGAIGWKSQVTHDGCIVFSDSNSVATTDSTTINQATFNYENGFNIQGGRVRIDNLLGVGSVEVPSDTTLYAAALSATRKAAFIHNEQSEGTEAACLVKNDGFKEALIVRSTNANSATLPALDVIQAGPGIAAQFTGGNVAISSIAPTATLAIGGTFAVMRTATNADTIAANEVIIGVTDTSALRTITINTLDVINGRVFIIKDESGGAATNTITVATEGSETIDGAANLNITTDYGVARLYSDGSNLFTF